MFSQGATNGIRWDVPVPVFVGALVFLSLFLPCCSTSHYEKSADKEAYKTIAEKTPAVPGMESKFSIKTEPAPALDDLPTVTEGAEFLGENGRAEVGAHVISLEKALALAVQHNRAYQNQKEALYLDALNLTLIRHQYQPIFSGSGAGSYNRTTHNTQIFSNMQQAVNGAPGLVAAVGQLAGTPGDLLAAYANVVDQAGTITGFKATHTQIVEDRSLTGTTNVGLDALLKGGGRIAIDLTSNFLRYVTGDPRANAATALVATITQPLMRGAGRKVAAEQLTQGERDLLYDLRAFARYRQQFTVQIASEYYGVLQDRDTVRNNYVSYKSFNKNAERERAFAAEGKRTVAELGRLEQAQLSTENTWTVSIQQYQQALDNLKIDLGLSTDVHIVVDDSELKRIKDEGIKQPEISPEDAQKVALAARLDFYTQQDKSEDASRKIVVAKSALKAGLDIAAGATVPAKPGNRVAAPDFSRSKWNVGFDTSLPFDRKAERNNYRASQIAADKAQRDLDLAEDNVKLDIRNAWRTLDEARRTYEIAKQSVELNKRRVEEQNLLEELGRAVALNQVDAQNDLNNSENSLTAAVVGHTIARLQFWYDMGILYIKENGQWEEVTDVKR